jgi:peptidyl-dipeptidase Dcp
MTSYKSQQIKNNSNERPHISIVCNFTKPTETKPSLLTFNEVTTLFHEFGHALHGMLANTTYSSLSGTSVSWDFVELPSQVLENWCYEKEALALFAKHYKTGDIIPMEYVEKIKESASFHEGMQTLRQLSFGLLDMAWHGGKTPADILSVKEFEFQAFSETQLYPDVTENCMSTAFSHIFQGGYSAGYYSYKWAEILDADAFEYFQEKGIFNKEVANKFKEHILSKGGTEKPMVLYKQFRGKEPKPEALLKRAGLL